MNTLSVSIHWNRGAWLAFFTPLQTTRPQPVTDAKGEAIRYPTEDKAKIAAFEALLAEVNRVEAIHLDPAQIKPCPKVWEARSAAARKRWAEERFRNMVKEAAE